MNACLWGEFLVKFGTLEYYKRWADAINKDKTVSESGMTITTLNIFTDVGKAFFMKYENGKVTEVREAKSDENADFVTRTTYAMFKGIAKGDVDPQQTKPKFNIEKAMMYMEALGRIQEIAREMEDVQY